MANENNSQRTNDPRRANIAAVLSVATISFFVLIPVVSTISIPLKQSDTEIISLASARGVNPYTEYLKFSILLLVPLIVAVIALNINQVTINQYWELVRSYTKKVSSFLGSKKAFTALILALLLFWASSRSYINLDFTLNDSFHEGEYLGFLPNFLTLEKPFLGSFMIHGFGMDVLTSLIANKFANDSNVIVLTRFFRMTEGLITYLGCFWIIWELVLSNKFNDGSNQKILFLLCLLFTILDGGIFFRIRAHVAAGRDTLFILQLVLTIRYFRQINFEEQQRRFERIALPVIIGITIPISVLYVYDRAAYFFFIYLLACALVISFDKKILRTWLYGTIAGFSFSAIAITAAIGFDQVAEISSQMSYWARHAKYITFMPPPPLSQLLLLDKGAIEFWRCFSFAILTLIASIIYLILDYKKNRELGFWSKNCLIIILLVASLMYMRVSLDRSPDADHGALITVLLLICLCLSTCKMQIEDQVNLILLNLPLQRWIIVLLSVVILVHPVLNPLLLPDRFFGLYQSLKIPDIVITRQDFIESYRALKSEIDQLPCFFTLSSEGFWYYFLNKPSCSKFSILAYAKTISAQQTVVREIDSKKPGVVLFFTGSDIIGRTPTVDSGPIVYQYFLNHYKPHTLVKGRWFWKRNDTGFTFTRTKSSVYGSIDTVDIARSENDQINQIEVVSEISKDDLHRGDLLWLNGTSLRFNQDDAVNAVYVSYGEENQLISVTWVDQDSTWKIRVPTMSLPSVSNGPLRVWGYDAKNNQLVQVGRDIKIDLSNSA